MNPRATEALDAIDDIADEISVASVEACHEASLGYGDRCKLSLRKLADLGKVLRLKVEEAMKYL